MVDKLERPAQELARWIHWQMQNESLVYDVDDAIRRLQAKLLGSVPHRGLSEGLQAAIRANLIEILQSESEKD